MNIIHKIDPIQAALDAIAYGITAQQYEDGVQASRIQSLKTFQNTSDFGIFSKEVVLGFAQNLVNHGNDVLKVLRQQENFRLQ